MSDVKKLPRIIRQCMTIGMIPTSYKVSLTYEEQLMWFCNFLEKEVIPVVNNNSAVVEELKNYFENLDVQEEINNKLDEMAESGELEEIIAQYLQTQTFNIFENVSQMLNSENLINGSFAETLGFYSKNDGGKAKYKIREITNDDVVDNMFILGLINNNNLVAEKLQEEILNVKSIGAYGDGEHNDTNVLRKAFNSGKTIYFPNGEYLINEHITFGNTLKILGENKNTSKIIFENNYEDTLYTSLISTENIDGIEISNLTFDFGTQTILRHSISLLTCTNLKFSNCEFLHGYGYMFRLNENENILFENCIFRNIAGNTGNPGGAIYGQNMINLTLENVQCYEIDDHLVYCAGTTLCENIRISNCYSYKTGQNGLTGGASITLYANTRNALITNSTFEECRQAIHLSKYGDNSEVPHDITISNCTIINDDLDGIYLEGFENGNVVRNVLINNVIVSGNGQDAFSLRQTKDVTISNCFIANITRNAIDIRNSKLINVLNNIIKNCTMGVILAYGQTTADNCIIKNNLIYADSDYTGNKEYGIYNRANSHNAVIDNNKVFGFSVYNVFGTSLGSVVRNNENVQSLFYSASVPTTGYYEKGSLVLNSSPAVGSPIGWMCTVTGNPATFVALANL